MKSFGIEMILGVKMCT